MEDIIRMDLQLFADDRLFGEGAEEDDPTVEDEVPEAEEEVEDDDTDLAALLEETEEEIEEETEEETEEEEAKPDGKFYTQAEIDALISSRLKKEQEKYSSLESTLSAVKQLEKAAGMAIPDILEQVKGNRVQAYVDEGMDEELARKQVEQELHFDELQERVRRSEDYIQNMNRTVQYERQKNAVINKNPLYKKLEAEIDAFSGYGQILGFEDAAKYIIGEKIANGELLEDIRKGTANKLLAGSTKRGKATIEPGSQAGGKASRALSAYERHVAKALGITEKEWVKSKQQIEKKRKRR
ncbi:MAG: hypothetical protein ACOX8A_11290 [Thermacetogeniaceae bacterium]